MILDTVSVLLQTKVAASVRHTLDLVVPFSPPFVAPDSKNLPYGRPAVLFQTKYSILHHSDYISAYSDVLFMPLWTSYTVGKQVLSWLPSMLYKTVNGVTLQIE